MLGVKCKFWKIDYILSRNICSDNKKLQTL
jgi:hypothetical protein